MSHIPRELDLASRPGGGGSGQPTPEAGCSCDIPSPAQAGLAHCFGSRLGPAASFATTEHFNLQTARSTTVTEANGRATIYLATLSSTLIALAFIGQVSRLGAAFYAFALILLPVLAFVGVVTFLRLVQSSFEDIAFAHRIGRLRDFYLQVCPELTPYLLVARGAGSAAICGGDMPPGPSIGQLTLTTAGMVAVVNSVVAAACSGVALEAVGVESLPIPIALGALTGVGALSLQGRHYRHARGVYTPEHIDRAAIYAPAAQRTDST